MRPISQLTNVQSTKSEAAVTVRKKSVSCFTPTCVNTVNTCLLTSLFYPEYLYSRGKIHFFPYLLRLNHLPVISIHELNSTVESVIFVIFICGKQHIFAFLLF